MPIPYNWDRFGFQCLGWRHEIPSLIEHWADKEMTGMVLGCKKFLQQKGYFFSRLWRYLVVAQGDK